ARIDGKEVNDAHLADYFMTRLGDEKSSSALRVLALQMVPPDHPKLTLDLLGKLLGQKDVLLQRETARTLCEHPSPNSVPMLLEAARNSQLSDEVRAQAIVGLAEKAKDVSDELFRLVRSDRTILRDEALRALTQTELTRAQRKELEELALKRTAVG